MLRIQKQQGLTKKQEILLRETGDFWLMLLQLGPELVAAVGQKGNNVDDQEPQPENAPFCAENCKDKAVFCRGLRHGFRKARRCHEKPPAFV